GPVTTAAGSPSACAAARPGWLRAGARSLRPAHARIALDNPGAARRVVGRVESSVSRLAPFPLSGRAGHVAGTRELAVPGPPYLVVYRVGDESVHILRV